MCKATLVCAPPRAQWKEREMGLPESECFDVIIGRDTLRFLDPPLAAYFLPDFNHLPLLGNTSSVWTSEQRQGWAGLYPHRGTPHRTWSYFGWNQAANLANLDANVVQTFLERRQHISAKGFLNPCHLWTAIYCVLGPSWRRPSECSSRFPVHQKFLCFHSCFLKTNL